MDNLTVIIPFFNGYRHIDALLQDLAKFGLPVIIVDDHSDVKLTAKNIKIPVPLQKKITIIRPESKGWFTGACNIGIEACKTDVLILNQDVRLLGDKWLNLIAEKRSEYAMIGESINGKHPAWPKGYIHGTFMYVRRDAIRKVGLMNAVDFPLWGSTCEYQLRICRAGFKALPLHGILDFRHDRPGHYGESITEVLRRDPDRKDWYIRTPPLISVIVPCYNYGRYLPDLVASMIGGNTSLGAMPGQTFQAFELIIIDDGSTDETPEIIKSLVDPWKGIRSIRKTQRSGTPAANNSGIRASFGRAVTIIGADDMMEGIRLETLYRAWEADQSRVVYDDTMFFKGKDRFLNFKLAEYDFEKLIYKNSMHCGILYSRKAFDKVGGYPEEMVMGREDWAMNVRLGIHGYCGLHIHEPLYLYRRENHNRTLRNSTKEMRPYFESQMRGLFPEIYKGERPMACCGKGGKSKLQTNTKVVTGAKSVPVTLPGKEGMTLLRYVGLNYGSMFYYGPVSGTAYKFGLSRPVAYVANKDLKTGDMKRPGLLEIIEHEKHVFKVEPAQAEVAKAVPMAMQAVASGDGNIPQPAKSVVVDEKPMIDITGMSLAEIRKMVKETELTDIVGDLIEQEKAGQNRKTVIALLEKYQ